MQLPEISPRDVVDADLLLDVREDDEWAVGRAPAAVHVPLQSVPDVLDRLPRDRRVAVVCRVGARSAHAAVFLRAQGVDAVNVEGGMLAWQAHGLPVVADDGPGHVA